MRTTMNLTAEQATIVDYIKSLKEENTSKERTILVSSVAGSWLAKPPSSPLLHLLSLTLTASISPTTSP